MNDIQQTNDEVIERVRSVREAYGARFNYDIAALFRHAREQAEQSGRTVVKREPKTVERGCK